MPVPFFFCVLRSGTSVPVIAGKLHLLRERSQQELQPPGRRRAAAAAEGVHRHLLR